MSQRLYSRAFACSMILPVAQTLWCNLTIPSKGGPSQSSPPIFGIVLISVNLTSAPSLTIFWQRLKTIASFGVLTLT